MYRLGQLEYSHDDYHRYGKYRSYVWYYVAGLCGVTGAQVRAEQLKSELSGEQIRQAEEEARKIFEEIQRNKEQEK